jgi:two-component system, OmpR family, sensor histidine kinase VanS
VDRAPGLSVRLKLTLSYAGFVMLAGALLLAAVWLFLLRYVPERALIVPTGTDLHGVFPIRSNLLHVFAPGQPRCWRSCWCSVSWEGGFSPAGCSPL